MIYEFALEPELVAQWCDRDGFNAFINRFGIDSRRIMSRFPKRWVQSVEQAFLRQYPTSTLLQRQRKTQIICHLTKRVIKRSATSFDGRNMWLENAENEHTNRPFSGIVAGSNPRGNSIVRVVCSVEDIVNRFDDLPPASCTVGRTPTEMAAAVAPLLRCCEYAVFVDPHFDCKLRFLEPFKQFADILFRQRIGAPVPLAELHIAVDNLLDPTREARLANQRLLDLNKHLPKIIPHNCKVKIVVWKERLRGQKLHNRYLLTDIGSVSFGIGLDCNEEAFNSSIIQIQTDDICSLSEASHQDRWTEYVSAPAFDKVAESIVVGCLP